MHIPDDPAYYEKFYFTPGDIGFEPIQTSIGKLGVQVCWDQWYPEGARLMALKGAELLIYPTAIGWESTDTQEEKMRQLGAWVTVQRGHAVANGLPVIAVNRVGLEPDPSGQTNGIQFWGNSFVAGPQGELLAQASNLKEENLVVEIDMNRSENVRRWWPFLRDRRIDDLRTAAKVLKGRHVAKGMRCIVIPATQSIYMQAMEEGLLKTFIEAGAVVSTPTCGPCLGGYMGILAEGERCVSTTNRNFVGRMGHVKSEIYLASPAVAAASAITGRISCPCELK